MTEPFLNANAMDNRDREQDVDLKPDAAEGSGSSKCSSDLSGMTRRDAIGCVVTLLATPLTPPSGGCRSGKSVTDHWRRYTARTVKIDVHSGVARMVSMWIVPMLDVQPRSTSPSEVPRSQCQEDSLTIHIYGKRLQLRGLAHVRSPRLQCILDSLHIAPPSTSKVVLHQERPGNQTYCVEAKDRT
jgi:hypothetical protein